MPLCIDGVNAAPLSSRGPSAAGTLPPMSDHVDERSNEDDDDREGVPLFWGMILLGVVVALAVWLFGLFPDADSASPGTTPTTLAAEPATTTTLAEEPEAAATIVDVLEADGRFTRLLSLVDSADLADDLQAAGPFTLFAPTDEALSGVDVAGDPDAVRALLLRHVVAGRLTASDVLASGGSLETLGGDTVAVAEEPEPTIGGAALIEADIEAGNGIIHAVGSPLLSTGLQNVQVLTDDGRFGTLLAAVDAAGLGDAVAGDVTVLAPTDDAFAGLPAGVVDQLLADPDRLGALLGYHVVPGSLDGSGTYTTATGEEVSVGEADVNGVAIADRPGPNVVALDGVLVPQGFVLADVNDILDLAPITFEVGSAVITTDGQAELDRAIEYLTANPVAVEIGGHTDADGSEEANLALSEERAQAVVDYLIAGGVDPSQLTAVGYGEGLPIADNETDEGRAQNRRIEFAILG
jgi:transforming growth factor-beta-induced protein